MKVITLSHLLHQTHNMARHGHGHFEFHYVAGGSGYFEIEGCEYPLREGLFFYTLPGEGHRIYRKERGSFLFQYLTHMSGLPIDAVSLFTSLPPEERFFSDPGKRGEWERWRRLFEGDNPLGDRILTLQFLGYAMELVSEKKQSQSDKRGAFLPKSSPVLEKALNVIQNSLHGKLTLDELAKTVGYDKYQLIRLFKAELGLTPQKYWTRLKVEAALELIRDKRLKLSEIAEIFAFSDEFHLSRTVKKWTGRSPREWRLHKNEPLFP